MAGEVTVTEFSGLAKAGRVNLPEQPALTRQTALSPTGTAVASAAFGASTHLIEISNSVAVRVRVNEVGVSTDAATTDSLFPIGVWHFSVKPGWKISCRTA